MSAFLSTGFYPGMQETFSRVIQEGDVALFARLVDSNPLDAVAHSDHAHRSIHSLMLVSMIGGLLHTRIPGYGSQCVTMQFEFLKSVTCGDKIDTVIRLADFDPGKRLATFQTDCYNQEKQQVLTGRAVMIVPN
jgi:acyl dehydratase